LVAATGALSIGIMLSGCELTQEEKDALEYAFYLQDPKPNAPAPVIEPQCFNERFIQPEAQTSRKIDILFVTDTSGSLDDERAAVADGIDAFVEALPAEVDYQIGVMLAHGSTSQYAGKLYHARNQPSVLKSK